MSGGVDLNALISIAKRVLNYDVHGFTIVNNDARYEERDMVDLLVHDARRAPHGDSGRHGGLPRPACASWCAITTLPYYTITYYAQWLLMEAREGHGYRISVSGTGGGRAFQRLLRSPLDATSRRCDATRQARPALAGWRPHVQPDRAQSVLCRIPTASSTTRSPRPHLSRRRMLLSHLIRPW